MAKKSGGPNKSQAIREYYVANPKAKPMEVSEALKAQGVDVTPAFVSTIRSTSKKKKVGKPGRPSGSTKRGPKPVEATVSKKRGRPAGRKTGRPPGRTAAAAAPTTGSGANVSIDALIKVKHLVESVGSIDEARAALSALEKLMK